MKKTSEKTHFGFLEFWPGIRTNSPVCVDKKSPYNMEKFMKYKYKVLIFNVSKNRI